METRELIQNLIDLQNKYARTYRAVVTGERLSYALSRDAHAIDVLQNEVREPLLEHVGHLPIIASYLHPFIVHSKEVDLGRVLIMLAIHDIGETVTGDIHTYAKTAENEAAEVEAALKLLTPELRPYFDEFEERQTFDAQYAKSIDALAPFIHEIGSPNLTRVRLAAHEISSKKIEEKKRSIFSWDPVLADIFEVILDTYQKIERGEPTIFVGKVDLEPR